MFVDMKPDAQLDLQLLRKLADEQSDKRKLNSRERWDLRFLFRRYGEEFNAWSESLNKWRLREFIRWIHIQLDLEVSTMHINTFEVEHVTDNKDLLDYVNSFKSEDTEQA